MKRTTASFKIADFKKIKMQMLSWANRFNICAFLDNHQYNSTYHSVECLIAVDAIETFTATENGLLQFKQFLATKNDWLFGHVAYDFKNQLHTLSSTKPDGVGFEDIFFFQPETVIELKQHEIIISSVKKNPSEILNEIENFKPAISNLKSEITNELQQRISKNDYVNIIQQLQKHILRGDCYELNFCMEFFAENAVINPLNVYQNLAALSPVPFGGYYKLNDKFLLCASPERYVQKKETVLISQPIKGTWKRDLQNNLHDEALKNKLQNSPKEISENVMVVDLVRNDLSKICKQGSVVVDELFGVYTFPQVHQLISTVKGELTDDTDFADVLKATFPMGSMTGAPKQKVMQLIEQYEQTKRGLYSGCLGYIAPNKDFDFNVVIRSILYNATNKYLSFHVGSGITFNSNASEEYEECLLKASAMMQVLE